MKAARRQKRFDLAHIPQNRGKALLQGICANVLQSGTVRAFVQLHPDHAHLRVTCAEQQPQRPAARAEVGDTGAPRKLRKMRQKHRIRPKPEAAVRHADAVPK